MRLSRSLRLGFWLGGLLGLWGACHKEAATPRALPDTPVLPVVIDARPERPDLLPTPAALVYDPADPTTLPIVEMSGEVRLSPEVSPTAPLYVYASRDDCLAENAPVLRRMPVTANGGFLLHLLVYPGIEVSLCAAADPDAAGWASYYGQAKTRFHVGPQREQELRDIQITVVAGPRHRFSTAISPIH